MAHRRAAVVAIAILGLLSTSAGSPGRAPVFERGAASGELPTVHWKHDRLRAAANRGLPFRMEAFPVRASQPVDIELEPFSITGTGTQFRVKRRDGTEEPLDFDPSSVALFRGEVKGHPGSRVFLALREGTYSGTIELGPGKRSFRLSSRGQDGRALAADRAAVFETTAAPDLPPGVPFCGVADEGDSRAAPSAAGALAIEPPIIGIQHIALAVETDYEFFSLFGDATEAAAYLVALYGEVSDIYLRDTDTWVELVFARIWEDPNDLFNVVDPSPLSEFQSYWNANMGAVGRDLAQLLSGRRDYPFGGQAYLNGLCGSSGYSVVGYAQGAFPDPAEPSPYNYDISVTAHEIGHNAGTGHTHDSPNFVDTCDDPFTTPQRGTIMSYCSQTWSGGNANRDLYFHSRIQQNIESLVGGASCVIDDCNVNGVADALDISGATSLDVNTNGVPDECEDCNDNLILDPTDIAMGSLDLNTNGIPDECEPDCNTNGVPDDRDIDLATSLDAYGNDIPDECETDCNTNATSDYTEIQLDMALDLDRNRALDSCQDCDADMTPDLDALDRSHDLWMTSGLAAEPARGFYATTGVLTDPSSGDLVEEGQDLIVTPDLRVLVTSAADDRVMEFDLDGAYQGDLVGTGVGGLDHPNGLVLTPDGATLLVASGATNEVLAYDATTGASQGAFVSAGSGGLSNPFGLTFDRFGNLFVTSGGDEVLLYDGTTGSFLVPFVSNADNGGLTDARGLVFKPDGHLLVTSYGTDQTLEYDFHDGGFLRQWALSGTSTRLNQTSPWGIRVAPNGNVFIVRTGEAFGSSSSGEEHEHEEEHTEKGNLHLTNAQIYEFDARNGNFLRAHVNGNDHGMEFPSGFDFVPGWDLDCNQNALPDSCDITAGTSLDTDSSGIPDECETDCNQNGRLDRLDIIPFGSSYDCNASLVPDECEAIFAVPEVCQGIENICTDGFDNDRDGTWDCFDLSCGASPACDGTLLFHAGFDAGAADSFSYLDDAFRGTNAPAYASGAVNATDGFSGGGLRVDLGGIDGADIFGMSGAWQRTFSMPVDGDLEIAFRYRMTQDVGYEADEASQVMIAFDGTPLLFGADDFVAELTGDGNGGVILTTGWAQAEATIVAVTAGNHTVTIGGYNSKKTLPDESTEILIDDVAVLAHLPPACSDGIDNDLDLLTDWPADPGCASAAAELEDPQCNDGIDNDSDGGVDFDGSPPDPQCVGAPARNNERPSCGLGFELAPLLGLLAIVRRRRTSRS